MNIDKAALDRTLALLKNRLLQSRPRVFLSEDGAGVAGTVIWQCDLYGNCCLRAGNGR